MAQIIHTQEVVMEDVTGEVGAASGSAVSTPMTGELLDIYIDWHASVPATVDLTITESTFGVILSKANANTDIRYAPRMVCHGADAAALTWYDRYPLSDSTITFSVAESDPDATLFGVNGVSATLVATIRWVAYY
jgi:hypothetical protein